MALLTDEQLRAATLAELADANTRLIAELERRRRVVFAEEHAAAVAEQYRQDVEAEPPLDGATVPTFGWGPGRLVRFGEIVSRNTSGAWLSVGPDRYPQGWQQIDPPPGAGAPVAAWRVNEDVKAGDLRTFGGKAYRCLQSHRTQAGWTPPATPALWAVA